MEAEYIAGSAAAQEAAWLQLPFEELVEKKKTIPLYIDNASALKYIENP